MINFESSLESVIIPSSIPDLTPSNFKPRLHAKKSHDLDLLAFSSQHQEDFGTKSKDDQDWDGYDTFMEDENESYYRGAPKSTGDAQKKIPKRKRKGPRDSVPEVDPFLGLDWDEKDNFSSTDWDHEPMTSSGLNLGTSKLSLKTRRREERDRKKTNEELNKSLKKRKEEINRKRQRPQEKQAHQTYGKKKRVTFRDTVSQHSDDAVTVGSSKALPDIRPSPSPILKAAPHPVENTDTSVKTAMMVTSVVPLKDGTTSDSTTAMKAHVNAQIQANTAISTKQVETRDAEIQTVSNSLVQCHKPTQTQEAEIQSKIKNSKQEKIGSSDYGKNLVVDSPMVHKCLCQMLQLMTEESVIKTMLEVVEALTQTLRKELKLPEE